MPDKTSTIVSKVWGLCNPLWDYVLCYDDNYEKRII